MLAETAADSSLEVAAQTIRDLLFRKKNAGLNDYEEKTLQNVEKLFVREWAIIQEVNDEMAQERYEKLLEEHLPVEE
jgi:RNA polymerase-interacting CarD/CdnL/TRCF family regulator